MSQPRIAKFAYTSHGLVVIVEGLTDRYHDELQQKLRHWMQLTSDATDPFVILNGNDQTSVYDVGRGPKTFQEIGAEAAARAAELRARFQ